MGIYWKTIFYSDINDMTKFVGLAFIDPIIDQYDRDRGYIFKEDLLAKYGNLVITENSYLIEYVTSTYGDDFVESKRLHIK